MSGAILRGIWTVIPAPRSPSTGGSRSGGIKDWGAAWNRRLERLPGLGIEFGITSNINPNVFSVEL